MTEPERQPAIAALAVLVKNLTDQVTNLAAEVSKLRRVVRWNWRVVLFDILLTFGLAIAGGVSYHAASSAGVARQVAAVARADAMKAKESQLAFCQASNVSRAESIRVWHRLFKLAGPPKTPAAAKLTAEFLRYVGTIYAPRNCKQLGEAAPSPTARLNPGGPVQSSPPP
jgi:hypothetical protein